MRKKRLEYLICTMCVLLSGFLLYGSIGLLEPIPHQGKIQSFFIQGCLGGFGFSMLLSGLLLTVRFMAKRSLKFKAAASVFWIIPVACAVYVGILGYFPYQIYNLVKIIKNAD